MLDIIVHFANTVCVARVAPEKPDILTVLPHNIFRSYLQEIVE